MAPTFKLFARSSPSCNKPAHNDDKAGEPSPTTDVNSSSDIEEGSQTPCTTAEPDLSIDIDPPPPDGGWVAWTQALVAHLVIVNTWGIINSFGVFQSYYQGSLGRPASDISWIGSMQVFFLFVVGTLTGRLTDAGYCRVVLEQQARPWQSSEA
ncbi:putative MFS monocarboxylate transporter [Seiridium unicorne]|uniref:MFS monocarboxylate transporter n=1 Tax=Seiridium unicorne TaxID=138068 RepID=A0ABR2V7Q4_9PEZI